MGFLSVLSQAHKWIGERVSPGDAVIDATAGGGVDSLFLAGLAGPSGTLYAFDIQKEALERTKLRLEELKQQGKLPALHLMLDSHAAMLDKIDPLRHGKIAAVMFNLGYLPGGDETVITEPEGTILALNAALELLRPGGIITCVLYPGHPGGEQEALAVEDWAAALPQMKAQAVLYRQPQRSAAPYLLAIEKRRPPGSS
ncbi:SAM-dependent methyltransferase [Paenibacillus oryzae]|uniref:SAM-dependent methyltransferase n=1 Tax=Paenibacillus oryzae TaxID=1844972 RepID=A0A1A5YLX6_9BACL|nr:class I SAM-dependent methyltransferase [Paenibacillus oryzae]OBR66390.1 SAM-dependent methyltransferase [Paenibacillus oryzae]